MPSNTSPNVTLTRTGSNVLITIAGDLDMQVAHVPHELLVELLGQGADVAEVTVDLSDVGFVDSTGLGGLIRLRQEVGTDGAPVTLRGVNPQLRGLLRMTGMDQEFQLIE